MRKKRILIWIFLTAAVLVFLFPILLLMVNSLMGQEELTASYGSILYGNKGNLEWKLFPLYPTLRAYIQLLLDSPDFFVMFWNSVRQVFPILFGQLLFGIPAAWALGRYSFRGRRILVYLYMILMILPFQVTMVSSYSVLSFFNILDTHWAVILPGVFSALPVFLMTKFFQGIPDSLLEAAKVDGAGEIGAFFYVGLPLGLPGIISSLILNFLEYWNAIEPPMTFLKTKSKFPVSLYLSSITLNDVGTSFAASVLIMAPSVFLFAWGQSYLEQGIIASGLKE
ncbi:MAG TPA: carbohydrate ABC transporter permease [Candidatus Blautia pullistercoris]|uniref:Carbohydrate ABC transporter permease n=1 Tax=Candidatus Blautia pullistercoris TaxID=2838499 RepID=A0A9D1VND7_9FIRM|nr:carbohydrate ABC transporter permease [Candidatus Blautia pullistercoris]